MSEQDDAPVPGRDVTVTAGLASGRGQVQPEPDKEQSSGVV